MRRETWGTLLDLVERLREQGSWCGETHVQKACYLLEHLAGLPLPFEFLLYRHGPFSFELRDELEEMLAYGALDRQFQSPPYGPRLGTGSQARPFRKPAGDPGTERALEFVCRAVGNRNVGSLERLSTALYVTLEQPRAGVAERASALSALKPHVSVPEAVQAVREIDALRSSWESSLVRN